MPHRPADRTGVIRRQCEDLAQLTGAVRDRAAAGAEGGKQMLLGRAVVRRRVLAVPVDPVPSCLIAANEPPDLARLLRNTDVRAEHRRRELTQRRVPQAAPCRASEILLAR